MISFHPLMESSHHQGAGESLFGPNVGYRENPAAHKGEQRDLCSESVLTYRQGLGCGAEQPLHGDSRDFGELLPLQVHQLCVASTRQCLSLSSCGVSAETLQWCCQG